jgi:hypothetical protein
MTDYLKNRTIRTGVVRRPDVGYLVACDPTTEDDDPHADILTWQAGAVSERRVKFNAHSACWVTVPDEALVYLSIPGMFGIQGQVIATGNVFTNSQPQPAEPRNSSLRSIAEIAGKAYAVGLRGAAFRLDTFPRWTRIDDGLPATFNAQAIHGFDGSDIYAVGNRGQAWQFDGRAWTKRELPTNVNLTSVRCAGNGIVYAAGHDGLLVRGRAGQWDLVEQDEMTEDIWDLEWFGSDLFVSTFSGVFRLDGDVFEPVDFGADPPKSTYHLSAAPGVLWSIGEFGVASFDGSGWGRVV